MTQLALLSDVHLREGAKSKVTAELEFVLEILADRDPDHAFVLGDLIEDSDSASIDKANVERVRELFDEAPFPVTYLLGNHDVENLTHETLSNALGQDQFHGVIETADTSVVFLDSTQDGTDGARGELGSEQRNWLREELPEQERPLVLCHHPLGNFDIADNEWFKDYPERAFVSDRKETLAILEDAGTVRGTISGHIHQHGFTNFRGMAHVSLNAFSKEVADKPLTGTYAEVSIGDRVTVDVKIREDVIMSYTLL